MTMWRYNSFLKIIINVCLIFTQMQCKIMFAKKFDSALCYSIFFSSLRNAQNCFEKEFKINILPAKHISWPFYIWEWRHLPQKLEGFKMESVLHLIAYIFLQCYTYSLSYDIYSGPTHRAETTHSYLGSGKLWLYWPSMSNIIWEYKIHSHSLSHTDLINKANWYRKQQFENIHKKYKYSRMQGEDDVCRET